jgi:hypothetical protein
MHLTKHEGEDHFPAGQASAESWDDGRVRSCGLVRPFARFLPDVSRTIIVKSDDGHAGVESVPFRLTYGGHLLGSARSDPRTKHKHEIRRVFHRQLSRFWRNSAFLSKAKFVDGIPLSERLANNYSRCGYRWVPLVKEGMLCDINVLFLRSDAPGALVKSGDIDNRIKTLLDALRMPTKVDELGGYTTPLETEDPFFVLLDDDKNISSLSVDTDAMLEPLAGKETIDVNDARLVITIGVRTYDVWFDTGHGDMVPLSI